MRVAYFLRKSLPSTETIALQAVTMADAFARAGAIVDFIVPSVTGSIDGLGEDVSVIEIRRALGGRYNRWCGGRFRRGPAGRLAQPRQRSGW